MLITPEIKVCGLTQIEEINYINSFAIDYVGFVFAKSKRQVNINQVKKLKTVLKSNIRSVGVFVNSPIEDVIDIADKCELDVIQLHGEESTDYINQIKNSKLEVWKAISMKDKTSIIKALQYNKVADKILLDSYSKNQKGGTGKTFDWNILKNLNIDNVVLAGGLNIANIKSAIKLINPNIVDVSSGVETIGKKDKEKIKIFVRSVKGYE